MPHTDPEEHRAYQQDYHRRYQVEKAAEIAERKAQWFQARKDSEAVKLRIRRWTAEVKPGLDSLAGADVAAARAAVVAYAANPEIDREVIVALWRGVSLPGRRRFLEALPKGKWTRLYRKWAEVVPLA